MHPFLPRIPGFHPLPPPGHVRVAQDARCAALGRLLAVQALITPETERWLAPAIRTAMQALRRGVDDARREHGPRLNTLPRPLAPAQIAAARRAAGERPLAQAYHLLDGPDLNGLEQPDRRRLHEIRQRLAATLKEAGERDPHQLAPPAGA